MKKKLTPAGSTDLSLPAVMAAGAGAGVAMWSIAIPPDVRLNMLSLYTPFTR
jgi:solute carrier family 25 carnitine/acylcarnitine transporter 20/29